MRGGGSRGGSQRGKRQATTPVGGVYKDTRRNIQGDEEFEDDDEEWTQVTRNKPNSPSNKSGSGSGPTQLNQPDNVRSYASAAANGTGNQPPAEPNSSTETRRERPKKFKTPAPEGSMRDDLVVEIQTVNGEKFKGSLNLSEARDGIFKNKLGLDTKLIHGIRFGFNTYPVVKFKLKQQIDVDALAYCEHFELLRPYTFNGEPRHDTLGCKIRGIRTSNNEFMEADSDPNIRWVKIEWVDYGLDENEILAWMDLFGERAGELTEDIHPHSDSETDIICAGTYSIKMRLNRDIPQLLPMWGKRIRVYHRGVQKLCTHCYGPHPRRNCRSEKVPWTQYVLRFMEKNPKIPSELYGRWWKVINDEFGEIVGEENGPENTNEDRFSFLDQLEENQNQNDKAAETVTGIQRQHELQTRSGPSKEIAQKLYKLTTEEEKTLSNYLELGMTLNEARDAHKKELEVAELRMRIRDNARLKNRGSTEASRRTTIGPTTSSSGAGRGGLSFN